MTFTDHVARVAAEEFLQGKPLSEIETVPLDALVAILSAELQDRERREREVAEYAEGLPF